MRKKLVEESYHLIEEWMTEKNERPIEGITAGARYKAWWHCKTCKNKWQARVSDRVKGKGCPACAGRHGTLFIEKFSHLAEEWVVEKNDRKIDAITTGSNYKAWWKCITCENQWQTTVAHRVKGAGCPACAGKKKILLIDKFPHLKKEWIGKKNDRAIEEITTGSGYKAWWKCNTCENQWQAMVHSRVKGSGCPACAGKNKIPLIEKFPNLKKEWIGKKNDRSIEEITTGSHYKAWWKCKTCKNKWQALVHNRVKGSGCPTCAGRSYISLRDHSPSLIQEWMTKKNDKDFHKITHASHYKAWWECKTCENQWQAMVYHRTRTTKNSGCPKCAKKPGMPLIEKSPHLEKEWVVEKNERPIDEITIGSNYKAWWKCKTCENQWQAIVQSRVKGTGCPKCRREKMKII